MNRQGAKVAKAIATDRREIEQVGKVIVDSAIQVHRALGPGLLESAYQACLAYELRRAGFEVLCEEQLPVKYGDVLIDVGYRMDMLVEDLVVIENKAVERLLPIHEAQLLTYLKIGGLRLGYLLNWHVSLMKKGIKRMVLDL
jgi:GxxExxY protein